MKFPSEKQWQAIAEDSIRRFVRMRASVWRAEKSPGPKIPYGFKQRKIVFNPATGRLRSIRNRSQMKKNEIQITTEPTLWIMDSLNYGLDDLRRCRTKYTHKRDVITRLKTEFRGALKVRYKILDDLHIALAGLETLINREENKNV